jgi:anaerobic selenocysteine-containing dehydrogenase
VREGRIVKIPQAADYPDEVYSPRGCNEGALVPHAHPWARPGDEAPDPGRRVIRAGERGEGRWREVSWEEAPDHVAAELKRIGETYGFDAIHVFDQVPGSGYVQEGANYRASAILG